MMANAALYKNFSEDRQWFFSNVDTLDAAKARATDKGYRFLAENQLFIEQEFHQLFETLKKQSINQKEFWLYCYYCSLMLHTYYAAYDKHDRAEMYRKHSEQLKFRYEQGRFQDAVDEDLFLKSLQKKIAADLGNLASTPKHLSKVRDALGFTNIYRIHFLFCRLAVKHSILLANELKWLEKLAALLGKPINVDGMVASMNAPAGVFNLLSVGLFAARFIVNMGLLIKHTFAPSEAEKALSATARFKKEFHERHCTMLNDLAWGSINLLCNYSAVFKISAPLANGLTVGFLFFDVSLLIYRRHLAERDYLLKKEQYLSEKRNYETTMQALCISEEYRAKCAAQCQLLDKQLIQLEIEWKASSATFLFNVAAASLLMAGFSATLLFAAPAAFAISYFVCVVGVAMYLSADMYKKYKEKSLMLEQLERGDQVVGLLTKQQAILEMQAARQDFIVAMIKNITMPLLIVTTFAVCWPAAVILTVLYIGYEFFHGYFKTPPATNAPKALASVIQGDGVAEEPEERLCLDPNI